MKGVEYISRVYEQLMAPECIEKSEFTGAFLRAALAVVESVESPLKEQTLVSLAMLELARGGSSLKSRKRVA